MITRKEFSEQVERLIASGKGNTDVMSAIIKICEVNNIEPESAKRLISAPLKENCSMKSDPQEKLNMINRHNAKSVNLTWFLYGDKIMEKGDVVTV